MPVWFYQTGGSIEPYKNGSVQKLVIYYRVIPTALEQFRFAAEKPAISKVCGDLIRSD